MRTARWLLALLAVPWTLVLICKIGGLRFNTTPSMPVGIYRVQPGRVARGSYVMFCPPQTPMFLEAIARGYIGYGSCPGGAAALMKTAVAVEGDVVTLRDSGVEVNRKQVAQSERRITDLVGRPLMRPELNEQTLTHSELLLMSTTNRNSFDGRYWGPVHLQNLSVVVPLFVWGASDGL